VPIAQMVADHKCAMAFLLPPQYRIVLNAELGVIPADSLLLGCSCAAVRPGYGKILFSKARGYRLSKIYHSYQAQRML